ncbi:hypothetical protein IX336_000660 [Porphyromonas levii]|uniref:hypothetical protein n=1 Tax=Porphyromonas levii TaxID=28114 RepID=UPI001BA60CF3|nr:hypothetical protein [Porphyromonas levii]MBR8765302.1 hypothetical protein [Porphyromonas levii]
MNKRLLLILICLLPFATDVMGQSELFTTYYGRTIQVGDTLWVGAPKHCNSIFLPELKADKYTKNKYLVTADMKSYYYQPLVVDSLLKDRILMDNNYSNQTINALCSASNGAQFYVNIDNAVHNYELQMGQGYNEAYRQQYSELTDLTKLLYYIHTEQISIDDKAILRYILLVNPELGKTCEHDKFTFRREKDHYLSLLKADLATFPEKLEKTTFYYPKKLNNGLGNDKTYDPEINGYLITELYDCKGYYDSGYNTHDICLLHQPCKTILEMSEDKAEAYERKLKGNSPYLNRYEYAMVYVRLMPFEKGAYVTNEYVCALLLGAEIFDHPSCKCNYLGNVTFDPHHYDNVLREQKKELTKKKIETVAEVAGGILGILSLF